MPDYDFHTISPVDFEALTRDLLQARDGIVFQSFKVGRDGGVDLRYAADDENRVVQCKHYRKSGYASLLRDVKREAEKIGRMDPPPSRYLLSTSVELSDANKEQLASALGLTETQDILGSNDLNNLLGLYPAVEKAHHKLWLASTEVLQRVLHNAEATQSDLEFKRIRGRLARFVQSEAYENAADQLNRDRILVLSGLPGVGKTTIADFLVYEKFSEGYQPVIARNGLQEARTLYREGTRQIFYYDDFLGATFLGEGGSAFVRNEDRAITDFLGMIADDEDKLLVLTTREHILAEALEESERLQHSAIRDFRFVVAVGAYTADQRGRILYNHAYFNRLPRPYLDRLLADDFYVRVIEHEKFSPRVIDWLTSPRRVKRHAPPDYRGFVLRLLNDASEIWQFAYDRQISEAARSVLLALHSLNGRVNHARLSQAFEVLHAERARRYSFKAGPGDFLSALRILSGGFITIHQDAVLFIDPSVRDLMNAILHDTPQNGLDVIRGAVSMEQVQVVWSIAEMRDGEHIEALIARELSSLVSGVARALASPVRFQQGGYSATFTPPVEERLLLTVQLGTLGTGDVFDGLVKDAIRQTIDAWQFDDPKVNDAAQAISLLREWSDRQDMLVARSELINALVAQRQYGLEPSDVVQLLEATRGEMRGPKVDDELRAAASLWATTMGNRLRDCSSEYELERLGRDLRRVSEELSADLRGPIQAVDVELQMYVEPEEPDPRDHWDRRREVPAIRVDRIATRELFDSLREDED